MIIVVIKETNFLNRQKNYEKNAREEANKHEVGPHARRRWNCWNSLQK
jgi:hypothetical protein